MDIETQIKEFLTGLTLSEKAGLCSGGDFWHTEAVERLGLPKVILTDGPHGLRKQDGQADHLGLNASVKSTCFPSGAGVANSWDVTLARRMGGLIGDEAVAEHVSVVLGPSINIKRNPLCGRNFEYYSEDPFLAGKLAAAYIQGLQEKGVAACPKHFAVNNQELLRMCIDAVVDERALREIYLLPFEYAVREGKAKSIMSSYNKVNGDFVGENAHLLHDILREEWGFDGAVVTDWGASNDRVLGLLCGTDLEMPSTSGETDAEIVAAVKSGAVSMEALDARVACVLKLILETRGVLERKSEYSPDTHHKYAREIAEQSMVLLKNKGGILPLKKENKIAIIGDFAKNPRYQGAGSSIINPTKLECAYDVFAASDYNILGYESGFKRFGGASKTLVEKAVKLAQEADVVLLFLGLAENAEIEGLDRENTALLRNQLTLLLELAKINKNIVVVLSGGAPIDMTWDRHTRAVLHGYLGGQAGGGAIFNILTGAVNPSGKLAETYARAYSDVPNAAYYPGRGKTSEHRESIYVGYRYYEKAGIAAKYPFGFGLSYTTFSYSNLEVNGNFVNFTVKNSGKYDGSEICQIYVSANESSVFRAKKELKGFKKVFIKVGESIDISVTLDEKAFAFFSVKENKWLVEAGQYDILVGASSADIRLTQSVAIAGVTLPKTQDETLLPSYYSGRVAGATRDEFQRLLGRKLPPTDWDIGEVLGMNSSVMEAALHKGFGRVFMGFLNCMSVLTSGNVKACSAIKAAKSMPFRALATMTDGMFNTPMTEGVLTMVNGAFFKGLKELIGAKHRKKRNKK